MAGRLTDTRTSLKSRSASEVNKPFKFGYFRETMQISAEKIWHSAQDHLRAKLSRDTFNMWFAPLRASAVDGQHLTIEAPNEFCEVWLKDNYLGLMQDAVAGAAGNQLQVRVKAANPNGTAVTTQAAKPVAPAPKVKAESASERAGAINGDLLFNPKNTFDTRSEEHTSELQSRQYLVCRLLLEK